MAYTAKTIKAHLKKLNDNWNDDYWIYVAAGTLTIMRKESGQRAMLENGAVDPKYISASYMGIEAEGGDW